MFLDRGGGGGCSTGPGRRTGRDDRRRVPRVHGGRHKASPSPPPPLPSFLPRRSTASRGRPPAAHRAAHPPSRAINERVIEARSVNRLLPFINSPGVCGRIVLPRKPRGGGGGARRPLLSAVAPQRAAPRLCYVIYGPRPRFKCMQSTQPAGAVVCTRMVPFPRDSSTSIRRLGPRRVRAHVYFVGTWTLHRAWESNASRDTARFP